MERAEMVTQVDGEITALLVSKNGHCRCAVSYEGDAPWFSSENFDVIYESGMRECGLEVL